MYYYILHGYISTDTWSVLVTLGTPSGHYNVTLNKDPARHLDDTVDNFAEQMVLLQEISSVFPIIFIRTHLHNSKQSNTSGILLDRCKNYSELHCCKAQSQHIDRKLCIS